MLASIVPVRSNRLEVVSTIQQVTLIGCSGRTPELVVVTDVSERG